jgi:pimeloyl-ACP methyl ester carboxylesterase
MSCEVFDRQLAHFNDSKDYLAVSYDPRAQGRSSQTQGGHHFEQHARDLRAVVEAVARGRVVLIGWSAGGIEVLEYLRVFGHEDVAGVVIIDVSPKGRGHDMRTEWVDFGTVDDGDQEDLLRSFCFDLQMDRQAFNREWFASMLDDPDTASVRFFEEISCNTPDLVVVQLVMSAWFVDDTAVAEKLDGVVPVMYFVAEESKYLAENWAAQHAPHSQVHSHGKHAMFWEYPDEFNASLDHFLSRVTASEGSGH